jgi:hypothetical protein
LCDAGREAAFEINQQIDEEIAPRRHSVTELLGRIVAHSTVLARDEIELTKQEALEKIYRLRSPAITLAIGTMICLIALMSLCAAFVITLTHYMALSIAALITGAALGLIGTVIVFVGVENVKRRL